MNPRAEFLYLTFTSLRTRNPNSSRKAHSSRRRCQIPTRAATTRMGFSSLVIESEVVASGSSASGTWPPDAGSGAACTSIPWLRPAPRSARGGAAGGVLDDPVDEPVLAGFFGGEPAVAVGVELDALDGLAGVEGDALGHHALQVDDLLGLDGDVGRL